MIESMQNSLIRSLTAEPTLFGVDENATASFMEFLGLLFLAFFIVLLILIGVLVYRIRKIRRLTDPVKERTYKH